MTHDPMCPKTLHEYEHDDYTYYCEDWDKCESEYPCQCNLIAKVRDDERNRWRTPWMNEDWQRGYRQGADDMKEKVASAIEEYDKKYHAKHDPRMPCIRCDISSAYGNAASIVRNING